jgi:hypothetical protein
LVVLGLLATTIGQKPAAAPAQHAAAAATVPAPAFLAQEAAQQPDERWGLWADASPPPPCFWGWGCAQVASPPLPPSPPPPPPPCFWGWGCSAGSPPSPPLPPPPSPFMPPLPLPPVVVAPPLPTNFTCSCSWTDSYGCSSNDGSFCYYYCCKTELSPFKCANTVPPLLLRLSPHFSNHPHFFAQCPLLLHPSTSTCMRMSGRAPATGPPSTAAETTTPRSASSIAARSRVLSA